MYSKNINYILLIGFLWIPVFITGNDIIFLSEIIMLLLFTWNFFIFRKIKIKSTDMIMAIPFFIFLYRIVIAFFTNNQLVAKEYFLAAKQLEYFVIYLLFINILRNSPENKIKFITIIKWLFFSYTLYILADGILILDESIRATLPFKPGTSSALSGLFSSISAYIFMFETINEKKTSQKLINFTLFLVSLGALILTFSRTSIFTLLINLVFFFIIMLIYSKNKTNSLQVITIGVIMVTFANIILTVSDFNYGGLTDLRLETIIDTLQNNSSFRRRTDFFIKQRFYDNYHLDEVSTYLKMIFGNPTKSYEIWDNQYIMILNNFGAIGIIGYFFYFYYIFKKILSKMSSAYNKLMFLVVIHILIAGIALESFTNIYVFLQIFNIMLAILFINSNRKEENN
jgi:hypothetical protein